jgi:hypothetical protein
MNHRIGQWVFGLCIGLLVAAVRAQLETALSINEPELVDPLAPDRKVGKAYVYRAGEGWEVSGYYRRGEDDPWHPFLMTLDASHVMTNLRIRDPAFLDREAINPAIEVIR